MCQISGNKEKSPIWNSGNRVIGGKISPGSEFIRKERHLKISHVNFLLKKL
jgi:hypothetical protein